MLFSVITVALIVVSLVLDVVSIVSKKREDYNGLIKTYGKKIVLFSILTVLEFGSLFVGDFSVMYMLPKTIVIMLVLAMLTTYVHVVTTISNVKMNSQNEEFDEWAD